MRPGRPEATGRKAWYCSKRESIIYVIDPIRERTAAGRTRVALITPTALPLAPGGILISGTLLRAAARIRCMRRVLALVLVTASAWAAQPVRARHGMVVTREKHAT